MTSICSFWVRSKSSQTERGGRRDTYSPLKWSAASLERASESPRQRAGLLRRLAPPLLAALFILVHS
jgi:hypothetical protein